MSLAWLDEEPNQRWSSADSPSERNSGIESLEPSSEESSLSQFILALLLLLATGLIVLTAHVNGLRPYTGCILSSSCAELVAG
jgi:hypothetical protein